MMQHKGYIGKVEFDPDARLLHGEVIGIRDVVTFQGRSIDEVESAFRESVDDYLAFCKARGEEPDKPCSGQFIVRIDSDLHRKANALAQASGKSLNALVAEVLANQVEREWPRVSKGRHRKVRRQAVRHSRGTAAA
jgi:predicted HicB family RNase H-like nuclease